MDNVELTVGRVYESLCSKDSRNPLYVDIYGWEPDEDPPTPRVDCACDNCFYGRDKLAVEILRLRSEKETIIEGSN